MKMVFARRPLEKALIRLLTPDAPAVQAGSLLLDGVPGKELCALAKANEVEGAIVRNLIQHSCSDALHAAWRQAYDRTSQRISAYLAELDRVAAIFRKEGISLVALKNAGIARGIFPHHGAVPMGDIDVLVESVHFRRAHQVLLAEGYHFEFRSALEDLALDSAESNGGAEYWLTLPDGQNMWLELQWRPVAGRWIRPDQEPLAEELMARSIPIPGTHVRLLAPEDNLLQVALHTAKHSYVRAPGFRLHLDVERIVRHYPDLDWDLFVRRVEALQVRTAVYFSLLIPRDLFGTPIPDKMLARLRPRPWKERLLTRWINRAGLFNPNEKKFNRLGYILFNALLYDDVRGLWRGIFPAAGWMRERYGFRTRILLPHYYFRRLADLVLRRQRT